MSLFNKFFLILVCVISSAAFADDSGKAQYSLFHPTPQSQMREFYTDRPDKTESPFSLDAGHFSFETDLMSYTSDRASDAGVDTQTGKLTVNYINLKAGLTNRTDLQLLVPMLVRQQVITNGASQITTGLGDSTIRLKVNLMGNDGGAFAIGVMPYLQLPTGKTGIGSDYVEGGIIVPYTVKLPEGFTLGGMVQYGLAANKKAPSYHSELIPTLTLGHDVVGDLAAYIEIFNQFSTEPGEDVVATADIGFTYAVGKDWQLDAGINLGVTDAADDYNPFVGLSGRF